jgi:hypothetical protein
MARAPERWFPPAEFYDDDLCSRCGVCCGSTDGHPCEHLRRDAEGRWSCEIYSARFGVHRTVDGHRFECVPIRLVIETRGGYACCGYVKELRRLRKAMGQDDADLGRRELP